MSRTFVIGDIHGALKAWLQGKLSKTDWVLKKGKSTIKSYEHLDDSMKQKHLTFSPGFICFTPTSRIDYIFMPGLKILNILGRVDE